MNTALLLIDIQNDYFPGGRMELYKQEEAADRACQILQAFRDKNDPIFHMQHISTREGAGFFLPDTEGAEIHESVAPEAGEPVIVKHTPNSFHETDLYDRLKQKGIDHLVVAGSMTHLCIDATVRAAKDLGFEITLIQDACATRTLNYQGQDVSAQSVHAAFIGALGASYAEVINTKDF